MTTEPLIDSRTQVILVDDDPHLRQVLGNLLANALDALTEKANPRRLWLSAEQRDDCVYLYIRDNGPGFSRQALEHAKEPFFTTKTRTQGLGLGLPSAKA